MEYLTDIWNWNDLSHFFIYLIAVVNTWVKTNENMTGEDLASIKILYVIVLV